MDTWGIRIDGMPTGVQEDEIHRFLAPLTVAYKLTSIDHFRRSSSVAIVSFGKKSAQDVVHEIAKAALQNHWSVQPSAYRLKKSVTNVSQSLQSASKSPTNVTKNDEVVALATDFHRHVVSNSKALEETSTRDGLHKVFTKFHGQSSLRLEALVVASLRRQKVLRTSNRKADGSIRVSWRGHPSQEETMVRNKKKRPDHAVVYNAVVAGSEAPSKLTKTPVTVTAGSNQTLDIHFRSPLGLKMVRKLKCSHAKFVSLHSRRKEQAVVRVDVSLPVKRIGIIRFGLLFAFNGGQFLSKWFAVKAKTSDPILNPSSPYVRRTFQRAPKANKTVKKPKPEGPRSTYENPFADLAQHHIPREERTMLENNEFEGCVVDWSDGVAYPEINVNINYPSMVDRYRQFWKSLLWAAEFQLEQGMKSFDLFSASLRQEGICYLLSVPGLAEGRPSVQRGDEVHITSKGVLYKGRVGETRQSEIRLDLHPKFRKCFAPNVDRVHVRFTFSRMGFRTMHEGSAAAGTFLGESVLLPISVPQAYQRSFSELHWANRDLNEEQREAVNQIVLATHRPLPYILFGPPGTGLYCCNARIVVSH